MQDKHSKYLPDTLAKLLIFYLIFFAIGWARNALMSEPITWTVELGQVLVVVLVTPISYYLINNKSLEKSNPSTVLAVVLVNAFLFPLVGLIIALLASSIFNI